MAPSRAYVPSRALLRALSRPLPPKCPFARPLPAPFVRGKRTHATKFDKPDRPRIDPKEVADLLRASEQSMLGDSQVEKAMRPLSDSELERDDLPVISWYEQDLDKGNPKRLISRLATAEDRKKEKEMYEMIIESERNPDYDDADLNRRLIDSLIANPNFADLTQELKNIKADIKTKEELKELEEQAVRHFEKEKVQLNANLKMATHQALQGLIDDPDIGDAKDELQEVLDRIPDMDDMDNPEFQAVLQKAMDKLNDNPTLQKKMAAMANEGTDDEEFEKEWSNFERGLDKMIEQEDTASDEDLLTEPGENIGDVDNLLYQMRDVLKSMGGDRRIQNELDALLAEDPMEEQEGDFNREMDPEELAEELKKLALSKAPKTRDIEEAEDIPAELQAKVDKIMEDPKLLEKLVYIQKLIEEAEGENRDITAIAHETAPDPDKLEASRTATLAQRMQAARQDPAHMAALKGLRVNLLPPFNISPALKSFNQAIELAYIGANDDIRRILWRSYQKARTLPTFLQNLSDEAWDILYYSQAVTWGSNRNRQDHLRLILKDLKSLGRDGPPTHPSTLVKSGNGAHLDI